MITVFRDHLTRNRRLAPPKAKVGFLQDNNVCFQSVYDIQHPARVSALIEASRFANVVACYAQVLRFHLFDIGKTFRNFTN